MSYPKDLLEDFKECDAAKRDPEQLKPCPHCEEAVQLQVQRIDLKNPWRDSIKCRACKSQASRMYWNHRPIENSLKAGIRTAWEFLANEEVPEVVRRSHALRQLESLTRN